MARAARSEAGPAETVQVVSPEPAVRWRVRGGTTVERSTDGGATWTPASAPAETMLAAGSAPSSLVCWLAGRAGMVLRTLDGERFEAVSTPAVVDLVAIRAEDALRAAVTAADGRVFTTTDGGASWR
jgi:photosystem II stability/assembly factor-like uncharacterized protein